MKSVNYFFSATSLFEGLENISEEEQLARLLALSAQGAPTSTADNTTIVDITTPLHLTISPSFAAKGAASSAVDPHVLPAASRAPSAAGSSLSSSPPPPQRSQSAFSRRDQLDLWKRTPVGERATLLLNEDFDPSQPSGSVRQESGRNGGSPPVLRPTFTTSKSTLEDDEDKLFLGKMTLTLVAGTWVDFIRLNPVSPHSEVHVV